MTPSISVNRRTYCMSTTKYEDGSERKGFVVQSGVLLTKVHFQTIRSPQTIGTQRQGAVGLTPSCCKVDLSPKAKQISFPKLLTSERLNVYLVSEKAAERKGFGLILAYKGNWLQLHGVISFFCQGPM